MRWLDESQDLWIDPDVFAAGRATKFEGTAGGDRIVGTDGRDKFNVGQGGDDMLYGRAGNDVFDFGTAFTHDDQIHGGAGIDTVLIGGKYPNMIELDPAQLRGVERVGLSGGNALNFTVSVDNGFSDIRVVGHTVGVMNVDASALVTGRARLHGSGNLDTLSGGALDDHISGGRYGDVLSGGAGHDTFLYGTRFDSETTLRPGGADTILDFSTEDAIVLPTGSDAVDSYHIGATMSHVGDVVATFDSNENKTTLNVFLDNDDSPDMTIYLLGDKTQLEVSHSSHILLVA